MARQSDSLSIAKLRADGPSSPNWRENSGHRVNQPVPYEERSQVAIDPLPISLYCIARKGPLPVRVDANNLDESHPHSEKSNTLN